MPYGRFAHSALELGVLLFLGRSLLHQQDDCAESSQDPSVLSTEQMRGLRKVANALVEASKGILAADESTGTIEKRLKLIGLQNTEANRRKYRQMLFTTPNIQRYISGVIFFEETFSQKIDTGRRFVDVLKDAGVLIGIKLDRGLISIDDTEEKLSHGLEGLADRVDVFRSGGCVFAKWRSVFSISSETPSERAMRNNAEVLARYAKICQQGGLVPIIEPEVLADGNHTIARMQAITERVLAHVYKALSDYSVYLEGTILKPNMVSPGLSSEQKATNEEIADATVTALRRTVPSAVPGIAFLSGGQSESQSTRNLKAIMNTGALKPWRITFSFGRALQTSALQAWQGSDTEAGQMAFLARAKANSEAITK